MMMNPLARSVLRCSRVSFIANNSRSFSEAVAVAASDAAAVVEPPKKPRHAKGEVFEPLTIHKAIDKVKSVAWARFDETVEISINTGLDPRKPNQSIKGIASLPFGLGKKVRVCVFAAGADAQAALDAGAEVVGGENLLAHIQSGIINFDTVIATPEMMSVVGKLGKILGPRGMMPNPKTGTVTKDPAKAVLAAKAGAVKFKVAKNGIIQAGIGKVSFTQEALLGNIRSLMVSIADLKPEGLKGKYLMSAVVSSTMGPGVPVELPTIDPGNGRFMLDMSVKEA